MFDLELIDAADPAELFSALLKYHGDTTELQKNREQAFLAHVIRNISPSKSPLFQDLFVLFMTNEKRGGYFVEFGATNGVTLSNSWLLEKSFGWNGILAEPARCWHADLRANRNCSIETHCVWDKSGERLEFNEVSLGELSTISSFSGSDGHFMDRKKGDVYLVETISLNGLLEKHRAPREIDYMSVDTEGSELTILNNFDFSRFDVRIITVEHNFTPAREKIHELLASKGYKRVFEKFSKWDDWYVKS